MTLAPLALKAALRLKCAAGHRQQLQAAPLALTSPAMYAAAVLLRCVLAALASAKPKLCSKGRACQRTPQQTRSNPFCREIIGCSLLAAVPLSHMLRELRRKQEPVMLSAAGLPACCLPNKEWRILDKTAASLASNRYVLTTSRQLLQLLPRSLCKQAAG